MNLVRVPKKNSSSKNSEVLSTFISADVYYMFLKLNIFRG